MRRFFQIFKLSCLAGLLFLTLLTGCSKQSPQGSQLMSIQVLDRNGFRETVTSAERLKMYQKTDFTMPQPYQKVVRIYSRSKEGKTPSHITTYHENGEIWQSLEVVNGRACGIYREWHPNGKLRLDLMVIEGMGDLSEDAQLSWVFDGISRVWDDQGYLEAEFNYEKGLRQGVSFYYFPSGKLKQQIPYERDQIDGNVLTYSEQGGVVGKATYVQGKREGPSTFQGDKSIPSYSEIYQNDLLIDATYHDFSGKIISCVEGGYGKKAVYLDGFLASLEEYRAGLLEGEVHLYDEQGNLRGSFTMKDGMKQGQEWVYYPGVQGKEPQPKLCITWVEDQIQGIVRTWFLNSNLESEREMHENQKHGVASAWYCDGSLQLIEEYANDELISGTYRKRGEPHTVSSVENGAGVVTLYDSEGLFIRRVTYEKGRPVLDAP